MRKAIPVAKFEHLKMPEHFGILNLLSPSDRYFKALTQDPSGIFVKKPPI